MLEHYILDENNIPRKAKDWREAIAAFETDRKVARTEYKNGEIFVSTVFLTDYQERYASHEEALAGHARACMAVEKYLSLGN